jgi:glutamate dehydrogenase/leucine dehydrogenase
MAHNPNVRKEAPDVRATLYRDYGRFMSSLRGCYVTAEDVGTHVTDMAHVFARTRFTTCIPTELGGSGNPSVPTARGVIAGMQAAVEFAGLGTLRDKRVAVQGMGNVGAPLIRFLLEAGVAKVIATDVDSATVDRVLQECHGMNLEAHVVPRGDSSVLGEECDIVSPCATGATLNPSTIPAIRARIVCGAANNQLEDPQRDDRALFERRVLYVPDFLTNRMGIVNCADEQYGYVTHDPLIERHLSRDWEHSIHKTCLRVFSESRATREPPGKVALGMAEALSQEQHPLTGHRGRQIIASLVADRWQESAL